jgi:hypothetical protein
VYSLTLLSPPGLGIGSAVAVAVDVARLQLQLANDCDEMQSINDYMYRQRRASMIDPRLVQLYETPLIPLYSSINVASGSGSSTFSCTYYRLWYVVCGVWCVVCGMYTDSDHDRSGGCVQVEFE